jgi:hypothetical protein
MRFASRDELSFRTFCGIHTINEIRNIVRRALAHQSELLFGKLITKRYA